MRTPSNRDVSDLPALAVSWVFFIFSPVGFFPCRISSTPYSLKGKQEKGRLLGGFSCAVPNKIKWDTRFGCPHGNMFLSQVLLLLLSLIVDYGVEFELHVLIVVGFCTRRKNLWDTIQ